MEHMHQRHRQITVERWSSEFLADRSVLGGPRNATRQLANFYIRFSVDTVSHFINERLKTDLATMRDKHNIQCLTPQYNIEYTLYLVSPV